MNGKMSLKLVSDTSMSRSNVHVMLPMSPLTPAHDPSTSQSRAYVTTSTGALKLDSIFMEPLQNTDVQIEVYFASFCDQGILLG